MLNALENIQNVTAYAKRYCANYFVTEKLNKTRNTMSPRRLVHCNWLACVSLVFGWVTRVSLVLSAYNFSVYLSILRMSRGYMNFNGEIARGGGSAESRHLPRITCHVVRGHELGGNSPRLLPKPKRLSSKYPLSETLILYIPTSPRLHPSNRGLIKLSIRGYTNLKRLWCLLSWAAVCLTA